MSPFFFCVTKFKISYLSSGILSIRTSRNCLPAVNVYSNFIIKHTEIYSNTDSPIFIVKLAIIRAGEGLIQNKDTDPQIVVIKLAINGAFRHINHNSTIFQSICRNVWTKRHSIHYLNIQSWIHLRCNTIIRSTCNYNKNTHKVTRYQDMMT